LTVYKYYVGAQAVQTVADVQVVQPARTQDEQVPADRKNVGRGAVP